MECQLQNSVEKKMCAFHNTACSVYSVCSRLPCYVMKHTHWFFNEVNACLQIHSKINELPLDSFNSVFLLLQDEHVMVEKLLQAFVCVVDAKLFKGIELEDFKACI